MQSPCRSECETALSLHEVAGRLAGNSVADSRRLAVARTGPTAGQCLPKRFRIGRSSTILGTR